MGLDRYYNNVTSNDFFSEISKGNIPTHTYVNKFGFASAVPVASEITIWDGLNIYPYPAIALAMTIRSSSVNDSVAGSGARTVRVYGLKADYSYCFEDVSLSGASPVSLVNEYLRVFRMQVLTAGVDGQNAGIISVQNSGTVYAQISKIAGTITNQSLMCTFTIPLGYTGFLKRYDGHVSNDKAAQVSLLARSVGGVFQLKRIVPLFNNDDHRKYELMPRYEEKTDIEIRGKNIEVAQTALISSTFDLLLVKNNNDIPSLIDC